MTDILARLAPLACGLAGFALPVMVTAAVRRAVAMSGGGRTGPQ